MKSLSRLFGSLSGCWERRRLAGVGTCRRDTSAPRLTTATLVAAGLVVMATFCSRAATYVWTGNGFMGSQDFLWSNPFNWAGLAAPSAGEANVTLVFSNGYPKTVTNDIAGLAVAAIQFQGSNYIVHSSPSGSQLVLRSTSLGGFSIVANGNNCQFNGTCPLVLSNSGIINVSGVNTLKMSSKMSGTGGFIKVGPGTLLLNATQANTYSGTTSLGDGNLDLDNGMVSFPSFLPAISVPATLSIGSTNLTLSPVVRLLADEQIADSSNVFVNENGKLWLNTHDDTLGSLTLQGGLVNTGSGSGPTSPGLLTLNGNVTNELSVLGMDGNISGRMNLGLVSRTFAIEVASSLDIDASISGSGIFNPGITVTGGGVLLLFNATNNYVGTTVIENGAIHLVGSTQLLGSTNAGTTVMSTGQLQLESAGNVGEPLILNGGGITPVTWEGLNTCSGPITLNGDCRFHAKTNFDQLSLVGVVGGSGILRKTGNGTLRFGGSTANTFSGGLFCDSGLIVCEKTNSAPVLAGPLTIGLAGETNSTGSVSLLVGNQIPDNVPIKILKSGRLSIQSDLNETLGNVELAAGELDGAYPGEIFGIPYGPGTFTITGNVTNRSVPAPGGGYWAGTLEGPIILPSGNHYIHCETDGYLDVKGVLQGAGAITQVGGGVVNFYNTNTYSGSTLVADGYFLLTHSGLPGSIDGNTTIGANARLSFFNAAVTNETLILEPGAEVFWSGGTTSRWKGPITIETNVDFFAFSPGLLILEGLISSAGGINLRSNNLGTLMLAGSADNTYSGPTVIHGGTLALNKSSAFAIPGDVVIGKAFYGAPAATLRCDRTNQFAPAGGGQLLTRTVTVNPSGVFDFNGFDQQIANLVLWDANVNTLSATMSLNGNITVQNVAPTDYSYLVGKVALANVPPFTNHVVDVQDYEGQFSLVANVGESSGPASLQKIGQGWLYINGSNFFSGKFTVSDGTAYANSPRPFGNFDEATYIQFGGTLILTGGTNYETLSLDAGSVLEVAGTNRQSGYMTLLGDATIFTDAKALLTTEVAIVGLGGLTKSGPGRLQLAGNNANFYNGTTHVQNGTLELAKTSSNAIPYDLVVGENLGTVVWLGDNQMADSAKLTVTNSGSVNLSGFGDTIGALKGNQSVALGSGTLTIANNSSNAFSGVISGIGGKLTKTGAGTLALTANNSYTGVTTVNGGTLLVFGQQSQSPVTVNNGTIGGTGTIGNVTAFNGGHISPGNSPGKLSSGTFNLIGTVAALDIEINGPMSGTDYDQIKVTGNTSFMGGALNLSMNTSGAISNQYVIIDNDGADAVGGTFTGLPQGAMLTNNGIVFQITYTGGDGNDVALIQRSLIAPPLINSIARVGGNVQITGTGLPGLVYTVEAAASLTAPITWSEIGTAPADGNGLLQFTDSDTAHYPIRFYRFRLP